VRLLLDAEGVRRFNSPEMVNATRSTLLIDTLKVSGSTLVGLAISFAAGLFVPRLLGPERYGVWQTLYLAVPYLGITTAGVIQGMHRELAILRGQDRLSDLATVESAALSFVWILALIQGGAISALALVALTTGVRAEIGVGILGLGLVSIASLPASTYGHIFRGEDRFDLLSRTNLVTAVSYLSMPPLVWLLGFNGAVVALVLNNVVLLLYTFTLWPWRFRFSLPAPLLIRLAKIGFPLLVLTFLETATRTVDRYLIVGLFDSTRLGYYSAANVFLTPLTVGTGGLTAVLYMRQAEAYGRHGHTSALKELTLTPLVTLAHLVFPAAAMLVVGLPEIVETVLSKYVSGVVPSQINCAGFCFYLVATVCNCTFLTTSQTRWLYLAFSATLVTNILVSWVLARNGYGLVGIAIGAALGYVVYGIITVSRALVTIGATRLEWRKAAVGVGATFMWCMAASKVVLWIGGSGGAPLPRFVLKEILCLLLTGWLVLPYLAGPKSDRTGGGAHPMVAR